MKAESQYSSVAAALDDALPDTSIIGDARRSLFVEMNGRVDLGEVSGGSTEEGSYPGWTCVTWRVISPYTDEDQIMIEL